MELLPIPYTAQECDHLLDLAEELRLNPPSGMEEALARFLGAFSSFWTPPRRERLHALLMSLPGGVRAVLLAVADTPNADVIDAAARCLTRRFEMKKALTPEEVRRLEVETLRQQVEGLEHAAKKATDRLNKLEAALLRLADVSDEMARAIFREAR